MVHKDYIHHNGASQVRPVVKQQPANAGDPGDMGLLHGSGRSPRVGSGNPPQYSCLKWQPTPVFFPGKFHGQRSLVGNSPWGRRVRHD